MKTTPFEMVFIIREVNEYGSGYPGCYEEARRNRQSAFTAAWLHDPKYQRQNAS